MEQTKTTTEKFTKIVHPGNVRYSWHKYGEAVPIFCKVNWDGEKLSITGTVGPKRNGDAVGGSGQINMEFSGKDKRYHKPPEVEFAAGWDADTWRKFLDVWDEWHLNDMRAGCKHQRKTDMRREVELVWYKLTSEAYQTRKRVRHEAAEAMLHHKPFKPTPTEEALAKLDDWFKSTTHPPDADSPLSGCYEVEKREHKAIGWVTQDDHPDGMMGRKCPACGYKYGSAWLKEEVPADVLDFLRSLPDTDGTPAWV